MLILIIFVIIEHIDTSCLVEVFFMVYTTCFLDDQKDELGIPVLTNQHNGMTCWVLNTLRIFP